VKEFDAWNENKKKISEKTQPYFSEREVRWIVIGINIGFEIDDKGKDYTRPAFILTKISRYTCLITPLTTTLRNDQRYFRFSLKNKIQFAYLN